MTEQIVYGILCICIVFNGWNARGKKNITKCSKKTVLKLSQKIVFHDTNNVICRSQIKVEWNDTSEKRRKKKNERNPDCKCTKTIYRLQAAPVARCCNVSQLVKELKKKKKTVRYIKFRSVLTILVLPMFVRKTWGWGQAECK